jgi:membrane protein implicated in regulation of membrane protease activity
MLNVYWLCFAIGGAFVLLAVLGGLDGADFGDADVPFDPDVELLDAADRPRQASIYQQNSWSSALRILSSLKFWTFSICFFGLTGLVLSHLSFSVAPLVVAIVSVLMGILCGALVAGSLRALRQQKSNSLIRSDDLVGLTGTVELPFDKESRGKVRLQIKGNLIDSIAYTSDDKSLNVGDRVLVIGREQNRLWVVAAESLGEEDRNLG